MDVNALKESIIQKQTDIKSLEARIRSYETEINQLSRQLHENQEEHDREMQRLSAQLTVFDENPGELPAEIKGLKDYIFARIAALDASRSDMISEAVRVAQTHEKYPYLTIEQKLQRRAQAKQSELRKTYISQLISEKESLENELYAQRAKNAEMQQRIADTEYRICVLRKNLRTIMAEKLEEYVDQPDYGQYSSVARSAGSGKMRRYNTAYNTYLCNSLRVQVQQLRQHISDAYAQLRKLAQLTGDVLSGMGLLERVRSGAPLYQAEKEAIAEAIGANDEIYAILANLGQMRRESSTEGCLPRLPK